MVEKAGGQKFTEDSQSFPDKAKNIKETDQTRNKLHSIIEPCKAHLWSQAKFNFQVAEQYTAFSGTNLTFLSFGK